MAGRIVASASRDGGEERNDAGIEEAGSVSLGRVMELVVQRCYEEIAVSLNDAKTRGSAQQRTEFMKAVLAGNETPM